MDKLKLPAVVETQRLWLRAPRVRDARAIFNNYTQDAEVTRFLVWKPHTSINDTRAFLRWCVEQRKLKQNFAYMLVLKTSGQAIGMADLRPDGPRVEIGYVLGRAYWGHGYMPEAVRALTECVLANSQVYRMDATCDVANRGSARVLEKAGYHREGRLGRYTVHPNIDIEPRDSYLYAKVKKKK